jgi:hypothetical protein
MENAILGNDFNLGVTGSFFHVSTHKGNQFEGNNFHFS